MSHDEICCKVIYYVLKHNEEDYHKILYDELTYGTSHYEWIYDDQNHIMNLKHIPISKIEFPFTKEPKPAIINREPLYVSPIGGYRWITNLQKYNT